MGILKKLLILDLDGTLIDKQDKISRDKIIALNEIRKHFDITIATGRSYLSALYFVKEMGIEIPFICFDGALISDIDGNDYFKSYINSFEVLEILSILKNYRDCALNLLYKNYSLSNLNMLSLGINLKHWRINQRIYIDGIANFDVFKIVIASYNYSAIKKIEYFLRSFRNGGYYAYPSGKKKGLYVLDILNENINKGEAVKMFRKLFNYEFIVSIGDYLNDLEMFRNSDISIAPQRSHKIIKERANYIINDFYDLVTILKNKVI